VPPPNIFHRIHHLFAYKNKKPAFSILEAGLCMVKKYQYGYYFLLFAERPHHGSHIVFVF